MVGLGASSQDEVCRARLFAMVTFLSRTKFDAYKQQVQNSWDKSNSGDTVVAMDDVRAVGRELFVAAVINPENEMFSLAPIQDLM